MADKKPIKIRVRGPSSQFIVDELDTESTFEQLSLVLAQKCPDISIGEQQILNGFPPKGRFELSCSWDWLFSFFFDNFVIVLTTSQHFGSNNI